MSLIQDFQENAVGRVAAYAFAAVTAIGASGCASLNNTGTIPVERVVTQSVIRGTMPIRQEIKREVAGALRLTACPTAATSEPAEPGLWGALKKAILPTTTVTIGDPTCGQNQQRIDQNGVAPRPRGQ